MSKKNYEFEIDLFLYVKKIYSNRNLIFKTSASFFLLGLIYSFLVSIKYTSSILFVPQINNENYNQSAFQGLANIAGINLSSSNNIGEITPNLYPKILQDVSFKRNLLNIKLEDSLKLKDYLSSNKKISFLDNLYGYTIGLPSKVNVFFSSTNNNFNTFSILDKKYFISKEELDLFRKVDKIINLNIELKDNYIELSSEIDNPIYSSIITIEAQKLLQNYIINNKIKSSKEILKFTEKSFYKKKDELEKIQKKLSQFKDNNQVISSSTFSNQLFKLQNEFNLTNSLYQELAVQLEQAKIQVTKDTPIFTILKDASVPIEKSSVRKRSIIIFSTFLGFFLSITYVLFFKLMKKTIKEIIS